MRAAACNRSPGAVASPTVARWSLAVTMCSEPANTRIRAEGGWGAAAIRVATTGTAFIREFIAVTKAHLWPYCALARPGIDRLPCATGLYRALGRDTPMVE